MNYFKDHVRIGLIEVPGEISLLLPLAGCGHSCKGCHSPEYQNKENGQALVMFEIESLLDSYKDKCTCLCIFEGEHSPVDLLLIIDLAISAGYKIALYSGYEKMWSIAFPILQKLNYLKLGEYIEEFGGLQSKTTNQRMYKLLDDNYEDITSQFWSNND